MTSSSTPDVATVQWQPVPAGTGAALPASGTQRPRPRGGPLGRKARWGLPVAISALLACVVSVVVVNHHDQSWHAVWQDNFDGGGVQSSHWNVRNNSFVNNERSIDTADPSNVRVGGGTLAITAQRERRTVGATSREYTSGYLDTIGRASWKYGKFEMRAKLPAARGLWPAFWLRADHGPGELDILEAVGGRAQRTTQSIHQSTDGGQARLGHEDVLPSGSLTDWHVYSVELEPVGVTWRIDGRTVFTASAQDNPWITKSFDEPVNIRLNLQVGGSMPAYYAQQVDQTTQLPASYVIDWVRVYQRS